MAKDGVYHEKQRWRLCALHSLNNLFQEERFTKQDCDRVCEELSPDTLLNPHRDLFGLGNYDVNIIFKLLMDDKHGNEHYETIWYDRRKNLDNLCLSNIYGFILNIPSKLKLWYVQFPIMRKHWITVRNVNGVYFNLDSKLDNPEKIGTEQDVKNYLKEQLSNSEVQVFIVVTAAVAKNGTWEETQDRDTTHND